MKDMELKKEILRIYGKSRKRYGSPRIRQQLLREGYHIGKKRVERLMRELDIQAVTKKKYKVTTDSNHTKPVACNHLNRNFTPDNTNTSWIADITYIWAIDRLTIPVYHYGLGLSAGHYRRDWTRDWLLLHLIWL